MSRKLRRAFYDRPALAVARDLLGKVLVRRVGACRLSGRIVEVEAYVGEDDTACHASRGRTARNEVMFGPPGHAYVYFVYGMHWMLNIVTERVGFPAAVLIRALEPLEGQQRMEQRRRVAKSLQLTSGPARLCQAMDITRSENGLDLVRSGELFVEDAPAVPTRRIARASRVGIQYARQEDREALWRFFERENPFVSCRRT